MTEQNTMWCDKHTVYFFSDEGCLYCKIAELEATIERVKALLDEHTPETLPDGGGKPASFEQRLEQKLDALLEKKND